MLWRLWLLVVSDRQTNQGTRSPIELFWTANKISPFQTGLNYRIQTTKRSFDAGCNATFFYSTALWWCLEQWSMIMTSWGEPKTTKNYQELLQNQQQLDSTSKNPKGIFSRLCSSPCTSSSLGTFWKELIKVWSFESEHNPTESWSFSSSYLAPSLAWYKALYHHAHHHMYHDHRHHHAHRYHNDHRHHHEHRSIKSWRCSRNAICRWTMDWLRWCEDFSFQNHQAEGW